MMEVFTSNPWLVLCALVAFVAVACTAIVLITDYLRTSHQAEIDAALKHEMLSRGMSAADIKTVLEASSDGETARLYNNQGVRLGLGKLKVELGALQQADEPAETPAQ